MGSNKFVNETKLWIIVSVSERYLTSDYMKIEQANYWRQYEIGIQDIPQNNIL